MKLYCKDNSHEYGAIGIKTPLVDKNAHQLCVGDVVVLKNKTCEWGKLRFVAYDYRTRSYYIMGNYLANENFEYELAVGHDKLFEGFGIDNVYYTKG